MSEIQEIDVFINPDGTVRYEIRGVKGKNCIDITKKIIDQLGGNVIEHTKTDEFDEQEQVSEDRIKLQDR
jgi:hypothetical protein